MLPEISFSYLFCAETSKVSVLHTHTINLDKILYFHCAETSKVSVLHTHTINLDKILYFHLIFFL